MRAQVTSDDLQQAVSIACLAVERSTRPILECLRLSAKDNRLTVSGANLTFSTHGKCEAAVAQQGSAFVSSAQFSALIKSLRGVVSLEADGSYLTVSCGKTNLQLSLVQGDFPSPEKPSDEVEIEGGVDAVLSCASFAQDLNGEGASVQFDRGLAMGRSIALAKVERVEVQQQAHFSAKCARIFKSIGGRLFLSDGRWRLEAEGRAAMGLLLDPRPIPPIVTVPDGDVICEIEADALFTVVDSMARAGAREVTVEGHEDLAVSGARYLGPHVSGETSIPCEGEAPFFCVNPAELAKMLRDMRGGTAQLLEVGRATVWRQKGSEAAFYLGQMAHPRNRQAIAA